MSDSVGVYPWPGLGAAGCGGDFGLSFEGMGGVGGRRRELEPPRH